MEMPDRSAVCENPICRKPLSRTWDEAGRFCCECGLDHHLFHRDTRWENVASDEGAIPGAGRKLATQNRAAARSAQLRVVRWGLKIIAAVAPAVAQKRAAGWFFTPRRTPRWTAPQIAGEVATSSHLTMGEQEIACWSWGRGPTVLLVHGWEGYGAQLVHFVRPLLGAGFRVVTFDMPAHGGSTGRQLTALDMSRALRVVAQQFSPIRGVIAHSLGAAVAVYAMADGLELDWAVLLAPAAEPTHFARILATALGFSGSGADGVLKRIEQRLGKRLQDMNVVKFIPRNGPPLLVFHDLEDPEVPFRHGEAIARAWPGARLEPLTGMGHRRLLRDGGVIHSVAAFIADQTELKFPPVRSRGSSPSIAEKW